MTTTQTTTRASAETRFEVVTFDLYRDIHKAIRSELFAVTVEAGRFDPASTAGAVAVAERVGATTELLASHARHEDAAIQPALEIHLPDLAAAIEIDHVELELRMADLRARAAEVVASVPGGRRASAHRLYVELASFTSAYLAHQDLEERVVMPRLEAAIGVEPVMGIHGAIIGAIPPDEMAASLALMLPVMNLDDRAGMLGGMRAGAPAQVFEGLWALAGSVLDPADVTALAGRLDI